MIGPYGSSRYRLDLSEKTIENHMTRLFSKLGVSRRAEVAKAVGRAE